MTRKEAIERIKARFYPSHVGLITNETREDAKALRMAIEALSEPINENREIIKDILKMMPTAYLLEALGVATFDELMDSERTGEWIFNPKDAIELMFTKPKCSKCGFESADGGNFCSNCGAMMENEDK